MNGDGAIWFVSVFLTFLLTVSLWGRNVTPDEYNTAVARCASFGGLKSFEVDADPDEIHVTCKDGSVIETRVLKTVEN